MEGLIVLGSAILAWCFSRVIKIYLEVKREGSFSWMMLFQDGGMPSGHTAITVGLSVALFLNTGISYLLAISLVLTFITVNDALKVRYLTGQQSKAINRLTSGKKGFEKLEERAGHTIPEVIVGGVIGVIVPVLVYLVYIQTI